MNPALVFRRPRSHSHYTYLGRFLAGGRRGKTYPVYLHDRARRLSSLILGKKGSGKTEMLLSAAIQDGAAGRSVVLVDAKPDRSTLRKLGYYCRKLGIPLRLFLPYEEAERLSESWNPIWPRLFPVEETAGLLLRSFRPAAKDAGGSEEYWSAAQLETLSLFLRALYSTGRAIALDDLLEAARGWPDSIGALMRVADGEGKAALGQLARKIAQLGEREFARITTGLTGFLARLGSWTVLSYRPSVRLEETIREPGIFYAGLPLERDRDAMAVLGRLLLGSLRLLTSRTRGEGAQSLVGSILVDEAEAFLDLHASDWIAKARTSGYSLAFSVHSLSDLGKQRERLIELSDHLFAFRTAGAEAQEIVQAAGGVRWEKLRSISRCDDGSDRVTESGRSAHAIPPEMLTQLRPGQCVLFPGLPVDRPVFLAPCYLPDPPDGPLPESRREVNSDDRPGLRLPSLSARLAAVKEAAEADGSDGGGRTKVKRKVAAAR